MERAYHDICLFLIRGISRALDQMEARDYDAAKKTLLNAWDQAVEARPFEDLPTSFLLK